MVQIVVLARTLAWGTLAVLPLSAATIFSTFGEPGDTYQTSTGTAWAVGLTLSGSNEGIAFGFVPSASYQLTQIRVADNWFTSGSSNTLNLAIWGGSTDLNTATLLESFSISPPASLATPQIFTVTSILNPILLSGGTYFVTENVVTGSPTAVWGWQWNNQGLLGVWSERDGGTWAFHSALASPALDLSGVAVPEPSAVVLMGLGLSAIWCKRRKSSRSRRVQRVE